jgi:hypothetical protein
MVSFNNGGNVRRFFQGTIPGNEIAPPTDFDAIEAANSVIKNFPPPPGLAIRKAATNIGKPDPLIQ